MENLDRLKGKLIIVWGENEKVPLVQGWLREIGPSEITTDCVSYGNYVVSHTKRCEISKVELYDQDELLEGE